MFDLDTDARRMLVRERRQTLALDALRPALADSTIIRSASRSRWRRFVLRWPALRVREPLALLDGASGTVAMQHGSPARGGVEKDGER
jgi:hypothetical protein